MCSEMVGIHTFSMPRIPNKTQRFGKGSSCVQKWQAYTLFPCLEFRKKLNVSERALHVFRNGRHTHFFHAQNSEQTQRFGKCSSCVQKWQAYTHFHAQNSEQNSTFRKPKLFLSSDDTNAGQLLVGSLRAVVSLTQVVWGPLECVGAFRVYGTLQGVWGPLNVRESTNIKPSTMDTQFSETQPTTYPATRCYVTESRNVDYTSKLAVFSFFNVKPHSPSPMVRVGSRPYITRISTVRSYNGTGRAIIPR